MRFTYRIGCSLSPSGFHQNVVEAETVFCHMTLISAIPNTCIAFFYKQKMSINHSAWIIIPI